VVFGMMKTIVQADKLQHLVLFWLKSYA
jgi:hypothetical protein